MPEAAEPTDPTDPTDPADHADPAATLEPAESADLADPAATADPAGSEQTAESRVADDGSTRALRAEGIRALEIVRASQLELFARVPPTTADPALLVEAAVAQGGRDPAARIEAVRALLRATLTRYRDPYAGYVEPIAHDAYAQRRRGDLVGIGLKFRSRDGAYPLALGVLQGGPLDGLPTAGDVRPGDVLERVDGVDLKGRGARDTRERLAGPAGSRATLELRRDGGDVRRVEVERRTVVLHYARSERLQNDVVHLRVSRFGTTTHERVRTLIEMAEREGATGYVLDLRGNPGGSTRAARAIVSLFDAMPDIYCERLAGERVRRLPRFGEVVTRRPLAVLVNERSMSSSEIAAGALQLAGRARIVGAPTWGKGLIQKVHPLQTPLGGAVRLTIATFSTPDGIPLHARGIVPDVYVPSAPHGLFVETGSLNVSAASRAYRRDLLLDGLAGELSSPDLVAFRALPDIQLATAIASLRG